MAISSITRQQVRGDLLKKIIIRIDYTGIPSITEWIEQFMKDGDLCGKFGDYDKGGSMNKATFRFSNLKDVADTLAIPLDELKKETIHRFSSPQFEEHEDDVVMDITSYFTTFTISCQNYSMIDDYLQYLCMYMLKLKSYCTYLKVARLGIRKIGGRVFKSVEDIGKVFNPDLFFGNIIDEPVSTAHEINYSDSFIDRDFKIKVNYGRMCREVVDTHQNILYQVLMDIDGYVDNEIIMQENLQLPENIQKVTENINNCLFKLFKYSVNEDFLIKNLKNGQE